MNGALRPPAGSPLERRLRPHYLFRALTDAQWDALRPHVHPTKLSAGERLFEQGQRADAFFVIGTGAVKLFRESPSGLEKIMRLPRAGQSFAESVLFSEPPTFPVHARTVGESLLYRIERDRYLAMLRESFETCRAVMAQMARRIHAHWDEIEALSLHGSHARVARYLLTLSRGGMDAARVRLPARKALIAGQLGLAPETLSRGLRALSDRGLISVRGHVVEVLNRSELSHCAQR